MGGPEEEAEGRTDHPRRVPAAGREAGPGEEGPEDGPGHCEGDRLRSGHPGDGRERAEAGKGTEEGLRRGRDGDPGAAGRVPEEARGGAAGPGNEVHQRNDRPGRTEPPEADDAAEEHPGPEGRPAGGRDASCKQEGPGDDPGGAAARLRGKRELPELVHLAGREGQPDVLRL